MKKFALGIEYDGSGYFGWQRQESVNSIQGEVERALSQIANQPIEVFCAGRTDAGVHAAGQVIHFETNVERNERAWTLGMNTLLPNNIAVKWVKEVKPDFHARFSATARRYRYIIYNSPFRSAILNSGLTHYHQKLNADLMHEAGQSLLGEQDFTSFRSAQCQSHSPNRNVHHIMVSQQHDYIIIDIQANAFLHHMVRNIVGSLCEIGNGNKPVTWMKELLSLKDRTQAAATAKPNGLYLMNVIYPDEYNIPQQESGPLFLE